MKMVLKYSKIMSINHYFLDILSTRATLKFPHKLKAALNCIYRKGMVLFGATQLNPKDSNPFQTNPSSNPIKLYFPQISGRNPLVISPIPSYNLRSNLSSITRTLVQILVLIVAVLNF